MGLPVVVVLMLVTAASSAAVTFAVTRRALGARPAEGPGPAEAGPGVEGAVVDGDADDAVAPEDVERANLVQQRLSERYLRRQSQAVLEETTGMVSALLGQVVDQAQVVLGTVNGIDESVRSVDEVTRDVAERTKAADDVITALNASLQRVGGIAGFIATVAGQTNLLSLNATIEAARAGAAGRGFGVVAAEVKELATTTARSTGEISETIGGLQTEAGRMSAVISQIVSGIDGVGHATGGVGLLVAQQRDTVEELAASVQEAIAQIDMLLTLSHDVDRRQHPRSAASGDVRLGTPRGPVEGHLLDISVGGLRCAVAPGTVLEPGATVDVVLLHGARRLSLRGEVRWHTRAHAGEQVGLSFVQPAAGDLAAIQSWVTALLEGDE